jgi:hypothetical protein
MLQLPLRLAAHPCDLDGACSAAGRIALSWAPGLETHAWAFSAMVDDALGLGGGLQLLEQRGDQDFPDFAGLFAPLVGESMLPRLGERSSHFRLSARATIGATQITMYSLLYREPNGVVRPLLRSLGTE